MFDPAVATGLPPLPHVRVFVAKVYSPLPETQNSVTPSLWSETCCSSQSPLPGMYTTGSAEKLTFTPAPAFSTRTSPKP